MYPPMNLFSQSSKSELQAGKQLDRQTRLTRILTHVVADLVADTTLQGVSITPIIKYG